MFCQKCGTQLSDDAQFCQKCGQPQGEAATPSKDQWEQCEIVLASVPIRSFSKFKGFAGWLLSPSGDVDIFDAHAIRPTGVYSAGSSLPFQNANSNVPPNPRNKRHETACTNLRQTLLAEGWELTGETGQYWWSYKFRRKIS